MTPDSLRRELQNKLVFIFHANFAQERHSRLSKNVRATILSYFVHFFKSFPFSSLFFSTFFLPFTANAFQKWSKVHFVLIHMVLKLNFSKWAKNTHLQAFNHSRTTFQTCTPALYHLFSSIHYKCISKMIQGSFCIDPHSSKTQFFKMS